MKNYVVFRNVRNFSIEKLLIYLRERIHINVRMKISVGRYGQFRGGGENFRQIQTNFSDNFW